MRYWWYLLPPGCDNKKHLQTLLNILRGLESGGRIALDWIAHCSRVLKLLYLMFPGNEWPSLSYRNKWHSRLGSLLRSQPALRVSLAFLLLFLLLHILLPSFPHSCANGDWPATPCHAWLQALDTWLGTRIIPVLVLLELTLECQEAPFLTAFPKIPIASPPPPHSLPIINCFPFFCPWFPDIIFMSYLFTCLLCLPH